MNRAFSAVPSALESSGFWKAFLYSFGSWLAAWAITWLASPDAASALGQFGWAIPLLNTIVVFVKQYIDAYQENK